MKILHNRIVVKFDELDRKLFDICGVEIYRPDEWLHKDDDGKQTFQENTNYLQTKPQIATVTHSNNKHPYRVGDKLFLHYMAHTTATYANEQTKEAFIDADYVFLTYNTDGTYKMANGINFGEQIYNDDEKTDSGIIINVLGHKPKLCQIKLIHLHDKSEFKQDDIVLTVDGYQYPVTIDGKEYIMVRDREIIGTAYAEV